MTSIDHLRLVWPSRPFVIANGATIFDDGLPPPTQEELNETFNQAMALWQAEQAANNVKTWPTVAEFWDEFSTSEKLYISSSTDDMVTLLRTNLAMWRGAVHANHPQIMNGLAYLQAMAILTEERAAEIIAP
jgi:hypothetical protein